MDIRIEIAGREFGFNSKTGIWFEGKRRSFFWQFGHKPILNAQIQPVFTAEA